MLTLLLFACEPDPEEAPTCTDAPSAAWSGDTRYVEQTDAWGLTGFTAGKFAAADLDGDGYPDLVATEMFSNTRDDLANDVVYHRLFMNREADGRRVFVDEGQARGLYTNRDGTFGTSHTLYAFGDVDADGDLDAFAGRYHDAGAADATGDCSEIYLNDGSGNFSLAPRSSLCDEGPIATTAAAFTDFDADGRLDLWVTNWYVEYGASVTAEQDRLYRGNGDGTFVDVTETTGLKLKTGAQTNYLDRDARRPAYGATACDLTNDTYPDLIATNYGRAWNQLWHNDAAGAFTEIGESSGFSDDSQLDYSDNLMYACWWESNGTGADPTPTVDCGGAFPDTYWNPGYDDQHARLNGNSFTTVCGDLDNDGWLDLYTTEIVHRWAGGSADGSAVLWNNGDATFDRADNDTNGMARPRPPRADWNEGDLYAAFADLDNDGWKDVILVSSDYEDTQLWAWRQVAPRQFEEVSSAIGLDQPWPAGIAVADFDRDGDVDVVTGSSTARSGTPWTERSVHLYENQGPAGNWLQVSGLPAGTRVEIESGGITQTQEVSGSYGLAGILNDTALHFGLGETCQVDEIRATAPGGAIRSWTSVSGNRPFDPEHEE